MSEKQKEVERMIAKVMKKKSLTRNEAMDYMLVVATGRLMALWRYDESVPEGKRNKGILTLAGRKKRAEKSPKISLPADAQAEAKPKRARKRAAAKKAAKQAKSKPSEQLEIVTAAE